MLLRVSFFVFSLEDINFWAALKESSWLLSRKTQGLMWHDKFVVNFICSIKKSSSAREAAKYQG